MAIEFGSAEAQRIIRRDRAIARYIAKDGVDPRDEKARLQKELAGWSAMFARERHMMEEVGNGDEWNEDMVWINEEREKCMDALIALREKMALYGGGSDE